MNKCKRKDKKENRESYDDAKKKETKRKKHLPSIRKGAKNVEKERGKKKGQKERLKYVMKKIIYKKRKVSGKR